MNVRLFLFVAQMSVPSYPVAVTDGTKHIFIDVVLSDYFEMMDYSVTGNNNNNNNNDEQSRIYPVLAIDSYYALNDDGRFCIWIDKRDGSTEGWINYGGCHIPMHQMALVLKNNIRPLFANQDEFVSFVEYVAPSIRLSFRENGFDEETDDKIIFETVLLQHLPVTIESVHPFIYKLQIFSSPIENRRGENTYHWNPKLDRLPIKTEKWLSYALSVMHADD